MHYHCEWITSNLDCLQPMAIELRFKMVVEAIYGNGRISNSLFMAVCLVHSSLIRQVVNIYGVIGLL